MKKLKLIIGIALVMLILIMALTYAVVYITNLPINLPFLSSEQLVYEPVEGENIAEQWEDVVIYEYKDKPGSVQEIIDKAEVEKKSKEAVFNSLSSIIDVETLEKYVDEHPESTSNGYEKLFIDEVDQNSTPTGIKTVYGDDVLAVDKVNEIIIVGINIPYDNSKIAKAKLAIVKNKKQIDMSIVSDLKYWDQISEHVDRENAILGINANGYVWNDSGDWASMHGLAKYHGQIYRKSDNSANSICFSQDGTMTIGSNPDDAWNATECYNTLIKDGNTVYDAENDVEATIRMAQTAIGQTSSGETFLLVVSGGIYGSNSGAVTSEVLDIMNKYGAHNAAMLAGGSRTVMYWNNKIVTLNEGYREDGVLLPTAFVVKPVTEILS